MFWQLGSTENSYSIRSSWSAYLFFTKTSLSLFSIMSYLLEVMVEWWSGRVETWFCGLTTRKLTHSTGFSQDFSHACVLLCIIFVYWILKKINRKRAHNRIPCMFQYTLQVLCSVLCGHKLVCLIYLCGYNVFEIKHLHILTLTNPFKYFSSNKFNKL